MHGERITTGQITLPFFRSLLDERRENWRIIKVLPQAADKSIHASYQVSPGDNPTSDADAIDVRPDYLHAIGTTFLPKFCLRSADDWDCLDDVSAAFDWSAFANRAVGPGLTSDRYKGPQEGLLDALYSAGAYDEESIRIETAEQNVTMRIVADGLKPADRRDVADLMEQTIQAVHSFWQEPAPEGYIISLRRRSPSDHEDGSITGTELRNGFAVVLNDNATMASNITLLSVFTHEYLHRWIGTKLTAGPEYRWFSEGFTEFLTWQSLWRSGVISFDRYLAAVNEAIENYHQSPFRLLSPEQIDETGSSAYRIPYWRGHLLALSWWHRMNRQAFETSEVVANALSTFALPFDKLLRNFTEAGTHGGGWIWSRSQKSLLVLAWTTSRGMSRGRCFQVRCSPSETGSAHARISSIETSIPLITVLISR